MTTHRRMRRLLVVAASCAAVAGAGACQDSQAPPVTARASLADSADQVMFGVRSDLVSGGVRRGELFSDTAFLFDQGTRIELRGVRANFFTETGDVDGTLTSREGTFNNRSGEMHARGDVVVQTRDGRRLQSPELRYIVSQQLIQSDSSFVLTRPGERLEGIGFTSDPNLRNVRIERTLSGSGGAVTLPGQRP